MLAAQPGPVSGVVLTFTVLVTSIALVAGLAWASARLLGLPVGTVRAVIAGLLGFAAAVGITQMLQPVQTAGHVAAFIIAALGVPLIVAMLFIVVAEELVPTGTGPRPVQVIRGALTALFADQPDRGAARTRPLPTRAPAAQRGCIRWPGGACLVPAACP
jgi:hypothetical protein